VDWNLAVFGVFVVGAFVVVIAHNWNVAMHGTPVERWARAQGFTLISEHPEMVRHSRILGVVQEVPQVHRIVVRDKEGRTRHGRVEWTGRPLDKMRVTWDD